MTENATRVPKAKRRRCLCVTVAIFLLLLLLFVIALILALTVFKPKEPSAELLSATVDGISPRISFPIIKIELNITLDLMLLVKNPNQASFKHGPGKSLLMYREKQVGEADLSAGLIPSKGSEKLTYRLTIEADKLASKFSSLISDIMSGQLVMATSTKVPGRVNFLGIFKKNAVATSVCQFTISIRALKIENQQCKSKTKF